MRGYTPRRYLKRWVVGFVAAGLPFVGLLPQLGQQARAVVPGTTGKIVFTSCRTGASEIWVMNGDGTGQTQLTNDGAKPGGTCADSGSREPIWSPDGTKIVFMSYMNGTVGSSSDIFAMNPDGTDRTNLTSFTGFDDEPAFSPDGTKIAWRSNRSANSDADVYVMNADGSDPQQLTHHAGVDDEPAWSPDGTKIAIRRCDPGKPPSGGHCTIAVISAADGSDDLHRPGPGPALR